MEYLLICIASLIISIITLFSGFGLGTVLMPVFAVFFPLPLAIASTAVVHLANNIFKVLLVGKLANWNVVLKFGIPAALASALGAYFLGIISVWNPITTYQIQSHQFNITVVGLSIGLIIILSSLFELVPKLSKLSFSPRFIPLGGTLSGFFGGVSGNQGVLRSAFLIKAGLSKEEFIGTSVISSVIVDVVRLIMYGWAFFSKNLIEEIPDEILGILIAASFTAFLGSYIGSLLIHKVTFNTIQLIVGIMLLMLGTAISVGLA
ncbi:MAG: sulfite exporter TauE/SafE family protein [Solirubrobacterales bacterium]|nr:sulfite exporter TauE/SafE family protein [Solirubrobacterales bacterium]